MIADAELAVQRQLTKWFIEADKIEVTLLRSVRTDDGAGGYTTGPPTPLPPQVMRLIPQGDGASQIERMTRDGIRITPSFKLLGMHDADMQRWDEFVLQGARYQVVYINENRQYEVKGEVGYLGQ